jgi:hypothetical protein
LRVSSVSCPAIRFGGCCYFRFGFWFHCLGVVLVEIKRGVELGLARQQFFQSDVVLEGPAGLGVVIEEVFFEALQLKFFFLGKPVEAAQRMLNALHGADRVIDVDVRRIGSGAADEDVGYRRARMAPAENFKPPEKGDYRALDYLTNLG